MDHQKYRHDSSQERVNEYLSRFKSADTPLPGSDKSSDYTLEQHLLERAVEKLRAAQASLDKLKFTDKTS